MNHEPSSVQFSPNKRFRMEYYDIPFPPFRPHYFIGMGCFDCPGFVRLVDNEREKVLGEKYYNSSHEVSDGIRWEDNEVTMKLFLTWPLPEK